MAQDGPKMAPRWPQDGPRTGQDDPKRHQNGPKMSPEMAGRMTGSAYAALEVVFRLFLFTRGGFGGGKSPRSGPVLGLEDFSQ